MTLAKNWRGQNVLGWFCSEKLDGCRAYWDGARFWTRGGNVIAAPKWFTKGLPAIHLDGEIFCGRDGLTDASNAVRLGGKWFDVAEIRFCVFDAPQVAGDWRARMAEAGKAVKSAACAAAVKFWRIKTYADFTGYMLKIRPLGGEGVMFRHPELVAYETGRSENLLRLKFCE